MFGRPDWKSIYTDLRMAIESGRYLPGREASLKIGVGTFFCGPNALAKTVREESDRASTTTIAFTFAKEHF